MGLICSDHIKKFLEGKTISQFESLADGTACRFVFTDGESLTLRVHFRSMPIVPSKDYPGVFMPGMVQGVELILTPYRVDGTVKQSTEIMGSD